MNIDKISEFLRPEWDELQRRAQRCLRAAEVVLFEANAPDARLDTESGTLQYEMGTLAIDRRPVRHMQEDEPALLACVYHMPAFLEKLANENGARPKAVRIKRKAKSADAA